MEQPTNEVHGDRIVSKDLLPGDGAEQERNEEWCDNQGESQLLDQRAAAQANTHEVSQRIADQQRENGGQKRIGEGTADLRQVVDHDVLVRAQVEAILVHSDGTRGVRGLDRGDQERNQRNHEEHAQVEQTRKQEHPYDFAGLERRGTLLWR